MSEITYEEVKELFLTYGWAILIVIIVASALYALGVFDPNTWIGGSDCYDKCVEKCKDIRFRR